ncbi:hypothetical protein L218DRAFT_1080109 [Marasmius fiardii PR-910]|nr:hypothetical protein L218DRAFT_1080109 [Marasmius fiardii PR-910]
MSSSSGEIHNERVHVKNVAGGVDKDSEIEWDREEVIVRCSDHREKVAGKNHHYTITLGEISHDLSSSRTFGDMLSAMRDSVGAHRDLYRHANIMHGHINTDTISTVEGTSKGLLKDWDMPLSRLLIDITYISILLDLFFVTEGATSSGPIDELFPKAKSGNGQKGKVDVESKSDEEKVDTEAVMDRIQAALATLNEQNLSLMRERGMSMANDGINRGEQLRRTIRRKPPVKDSLMEEDDSVKESLAQVLLGGLLTAAGPLD